MPVQLHEFQSPLTVRYVSKLNAHMSHVSVNREQKQRNDRLLCLRSPATPIVGTTAEANRNVVNMF
jgi:hypothetical protein